MGALLTPTATAELPARFALTAAGARSPSCCPSHPEAASVERWALPERLLEALGELTGLADGSPPMVIAGT